MVQLREKLTKIGLTQPTILPHNHGLNADGTHRTNLFQSSTDSLLLSEMMMINQLKFATPLSLLNTLNLDILSQLCAYNGLTWWFARPETCLSLNKEWRTFMETSVFSSKLPLLPSCSMFHSVTEFSSPELSQFHNSLSHLSLSSPSLSCTMRWENLWSEKEWEETNKLEQSSLLDGLLKTLTIEFFNTFV